MANLAGTAGHDTLIGTSVNDILRGDSGNDTLTAGDGQDVVSGDLGDDHLDGEAGFDQANYLNATGSVSVNLATGRATGADGNDTLLGIEGVNGGPYGDLIVGDANGSFLYGYGGNDTISGGVSSFDFISGGQGNDSLDGGMGYSDIVDYQGASGPVNIDLTTGRTSGADGNDTLVGFEQVHGSGFGDLIVGDAGRNVVHGFGGNDTIIAGSGDDHFSGGLGDDYLDGGTGSDFVAFGGIGPVSVNLTTGRATGAEGNDTLIGVEGVSGGAYADLLAGDSSSNELHGYGGDDTLQGGDGNDYLDGGQGGIDQVFFAGPRNSYTIVDLGRGGWRVTDNQGSGGTDQLVSIELLVFDDDTRGATSINAIGANGSLTNGASMAGTAVVDTITFASASGAVTVDLAGGTASGPGGRISVSSIEAVIGSAFADTLKGLGGNDELDGGAGIDTAIFMGTRSTYSISVTGTNGSISSTLTVSSASEGIDKLANIERLAFSDVKLAFDIGSGTTLGNGANAALLTVALLGKAGLANKAAVGAVLGLLDSGLTVAATCDLAVSSGVVSTLAGGSTSNAFARLLVGNLTGAEDAALVSTVAGLVDSGAQTNGALINAAALLDLNKTNVNLTGLAQNGVEFF